MKAGEPFNPYQLFHGLFVPEALARYRGVSPGAKLAYGRLARYAGQNGECYPAVPTLAYEIGVSERQCRRYVTELSRTKFVLRIARFDGSGQTSNGFVFLWHAIFENHQQRPEGGSGRTDVSGEGRTDESAGGRTDMSGEESHPEESHFEENNDLDCLLTNRKKRDSQPGALSPSVCKQYPRLKEALARYMISVPDDEKVYLRDRRVVEVMDAAGGASEEEVIACLRHLYEERGLKPGTRNGPRSFAWFATVVQDYFSKRVSRAQAANPTGVAGWVDGSAIRELNPQQFDDLTDAFDTTS